MAVKKNAAGRKANTTENKKQAAVKKTAKKPAVKKTAVKKSAAKAPAAKKAAVKKEEPKKTTKKAPKKAASFVASPDIENAAYNDSSASFLSGNACFYNRELSWLEFDDRILHEARDSKNPLLERLNFLSITASNLDEFYIVRVASLRDMQSIDFAERDIAGFSIDEQLERIDQKTRRTMSLMYSTYTRSLVPSLAQEKIFLRNYDELSDQLKAIADSYFKAVLYPIITPMAVDSSRPFPLIYNRMLNMCVMLENEPKKIKLQERATDGISNAKKLDIGVFLKDRIIEYFKEKNTPINLKYIDPSYIIRSVPANSQDARICDSYARNAVHAAMAGKTDLIIGDWHGVYVHVPIAAATSSRKKVDPEGSLWTSVIAATGQPHIWE